MATSSWNGGIIRPIPVAPAGPYSDGAASGIWTLDQVAYWTKQGLWPIAGNLPPRGLFSMGFTGAATNVIQYITITTTGNSIDFGDVTIARFLGASCASSTRGIFGGGNGPQNTIDYVTISTLGNATDFGDLITAFDPYGASACGACSSSTRGIFAGGNGPSNVIQYITIASVGNATVCFANTAITNSL